MGGKRKETGKPRGVKNAYACFIQKTREDLGKERPGDKVVFSEFAKNCSELWKNMDATAKIPFYDMASKDKERRDAEMARYYASPMRMRAHFYGKKGKKEKDPLAPKKPLSPFFWFLSDERAKTKAANPEFSLGQISQELGRRWGQVGAVVRAKYDRMAARDKRRYESEMEAFTRGATVATVELEDDDDDVKEIPVPEQEDNTEGVNYTLSSNE